MIKMKLMADVPGVGKKGETVTVSDEVGHPLIGQSLGQPIQFIKQGKRTGAKIERIEPRRPRRTNDDDND